MSFRCGTLKHFGGRCSRSSPDDSSQIGCCLRSACICRFVPFETRTTQTNRPPGPKGGRRGSVAILKTFLFLRRIANRCYRRVVSCLRCCFVFPSVGLVWIWMVFSLPCAQEGTPIGPPLGGGRIFCEGDHSRFAWKTFSKVVRLRKTVFV